MKARIKMTRVHQKNGPDFWQADCYMLGHTFQSVGMTQQKALDKMYGYIDKVAFRDWHLAHMINSRFDYLLELEIKLEAERAAYAATQEPEKKKGLFARMVRYVSN